jgi:broad specificity phosphatase PhoE
MKQLITLFFIFLSYFGVSQVSIDKAAIETTLNNYIDAFYKGDTIKLKAAITPKLYKFGYKKDETSGEYNFYAQMNFKDAMAFVTKMKAEGRTRDENKIRKVEVLDIGNHIASAKVTAVWGIDYMLLSKDNGKWMIEQVIWEGPYQETPETKPTTYYLVRHAEKDRSDVENKNPDLTEAGYQRAKNWNIILNHVDFDMVYTTNYNRTIQTAQFVAERTNISPTIYDANNLITDEFLQLTKGKTVFIVGHSNTIPQIVNQLIGENKFEDISDSENGSLFIVTKFNNTVTDQLLIIN